MENIVVAAISSRNAINQPDESIDNMWKWTAAAKEQGAELVLFPELNVSGYIPAPIAKEIAESVPGPSTEKIIRIACEYGLTIGFGVIEREAGLSFCTHVLVNSAGILGKQRKIHVPEQEKSFWTGGDSVQVFDIGKAKVGITICRDSFFDEMTRSLYFKGAEIVLMPFGYYNVPRSRYLSDTIHGMSILKAAWANGYYTVACNSAERRQPNEWEQEGKLFPGWAGIISPWGRVMAVADGDGNFETMVVAELCHSELQDRRGHPNFLAEELRPELYQFTHD